MRIRKRSCSDKGLSLIEIGGILAVLGILTGISVVAISRLTDSADNTVVESRINSVANIILGLGTERQSDGSYNLAGALNPDPDAADAKPTTKELVESLNGELTGTTFIGFASGLSVDKDGAFKADLPELQDGVEGSPNTVSVWLNDMPIKIYGSTIGKGQLALAVISVNADTQHCAIVVRSGLHAGRGFDSWVKKGNAKSPDSRQAFCIPPSNGAALEDGDVAVTAPGCISESDRESGDETGLLVNGTPSSSKCVGLGDGKNGRSIMSLYFPEPPDADRSTTELQPASSKSPS